MTNSKDLLADYAKNGSEAAFRELVARYIDLVYSTALRIVEGDAHRAKDVAQVVFVDLARQAPKLGRQTMLGGWLHRATCFAAANVMRGERRRQAREREAAEMNALNSAATELDHLAPVLDEAINELAEEDRKAILLRFYERLDLRSVGEALGSSENAAQKRVSRALEALRGALTRRGVSLPAAMLATALAGEAVTAAPVGLAAAISGTALTAAAAVSGTSTAALKLFTVASIQKTLVAAVLVAALGTVAYRVHQLSIARGEIQSLAQQQAGLAEQIRQLERQREQATNLLAGAQEDNARLKSGQMLAEVLRLRGQVGALRQELATNEVGAHPTLMSRLVGDPAVKQQIYEDTRQWARGVLDPIFKDLKVMPEQVDKATRMCAETGLKELDWFATITPGTLSQAELRQTEEKFLTDLYQQLLPVVGENGIARIKTLHEELPAHTTVSLLNGQLGAEQLSDEQSAHLVQIVKAEPLDLTCGIARGGDVAFWGKPQDIQDHLAKIEASNEHVLQEANSFLNPAQLSALSMVLSNGINYRVFNAAAFIQQR